MHPSTHTITSNSTPQTYANYDFRLCPDSIFSNVGTTISAFNPPQPGFTNTYHVCYQNNGSQTDNATLTFSLSGDAAEYASIADASGGFVSGNSITWDITDAPIFGQNCFTVVVQMQPTTPLDYQLIASANITLSTNQDINLSDNADQNTQTVVGSYDPNDKTVDPTAIEFLDTFVPQRLTYTVRFQNTGTFPATFIEVLDTLAPLLDIRSLELISASHPYTLTVLDDHILKFRFDDINLPDSTSDEAGSHGYVMFSIKTVEGLEFGDVVQNNAAIYFDYNTPVITNTATTNIYLVGTHQPTTNLPLQIQPNPTQNTSTLTFESIQHGTAVLEIVNSVGQKMQHQIVQTNIGMQAFPIDFSKLPDGIYLVRVISGSRVGTAKVVVSR